MTSLTELSTSQLHRIIAIREQIEELQSEIESIAGGSSRAPGRPPGGKKGGISAAGRARIAAAAKARWARVNANKGESAPKKRRKFSPAVRAKIAAAAKARWAKAKAAGKSHL
ncbi:MAG TPA: hypothetical protein VGO67_26275 [Verrucomicrobiae bacterium]|jgi:hypothetical protein